MSENVKLSEDEIMAGMLISDRRLQLQAALNATIQLEAGYIAQLQEKYQLDDRYVLRKWLTGFETVTPLETGTANGEPNNL